MKKEMLKVANGKIDDMIMKNIHLVSKVLIPCRKEPFSYYYLI
jgi:hypothetical protein